MQAVRRFFILWILVGLIAGPLAYAGAGFIQAEGERVAEAYGPAWKQPAVDGWIYATLSLSAGIAGLLTLNSARKA